MMTCVLYKLCSYMPNVVDSFGDILGVACRTASHHNLYILTLTHISPDWCCMSDSGAMLHHLSFDCFAVFPLLKQPVYLRNQRKKFFAVRLFRRKLAQLA